ncbi:MAG TPA: hypothetical protein DDY14_07915 [Chromatiaceae bacterium]|nr:hypothetical protein [Chromatiaceae bacterium]
MGRPHSIPMALPPLAGIVMVLDDSNDNTVLPVESTDELTGEPTEEIVNQPIAEKTTHEKTSPDTAEPKETTPNKTQKQAPDTEVT